MALDNNYSIIPPSGAFGEQWPQNFNLTQGISGQLSTAGWTLDNIPSGNFGNEGFIQQTFLGASIRSFDLNAGFGDTTSTMNIQLVNDEFNKSDGTNLGQGDDVYHSGTRDTFMPPVVGTPVYFKFGKNPATVEQAFRQTYDDIYDIPTLPEKTNSNNAFGEDFPQEDYDPNEFPDLEPYHMIDLVARKIEDRSKLWDNDTQWRGRNHFAFGGVLQSYTQNKSSQGAPLYSVTLTDPREILSSVEVLLNNYQGTTFNNKNIINLYGFLEHDPSTQLQQFMRSSKRMAGIVEKVSDPFGNIDYFGIQANWSDVEGWETDPFQTPANILTDDFFWGSDGLPSLNISGNLVNLQDQFYFGKTTFTNNTLPEFFPITGQGFSRRTDKGMPWYRISQGLAAMFKYYGFYPKGVLENQSEYDLAGFGGRINFRGYNYVVDFSGIPTEKIPLLYYLDFDKIDLLSLALELCDIISHELYVTLLPVIDHPASKFLHDYNNSEWNAGRGENIVAGIIRLDAIDKTLQPKYGAIKSYLDELEDRGINVENQDVGFELSNVTTDKFVVGAQEVDMYLFSTERDRDTLWKRENNVDNLRVLQQQQWKLGIQEQQQVLPYFGQLGNGAVSIPRGFGPFQQILLDSRDLDAFGVANYYVATEIELRAALVSFESWKNFLLSYNDTYIEDISEHSAFFDALSSQNDQVIDVLNDFKVKSGFDDLDSSDAKSKIEEYLEGMKNRNYAVTVPRCVWASDRPYVDDDGLPASPCSPPLGYPLYYKRATRIGIVEAGIAGILNTKTRVVKDLERLKKDFENQNSPLLKLSKTTLGRRIADLERRLSSVVVSGRASGDDRYKQTEKYKDLVRSIEEAKEIYNNFAEMRKNLSNTKGAIAWIEKLGDPNNGDLGRFMANIEKTAKKHTENAKKVYEFVRKIADECLGKKYLVRIPKACNLNYNVQIRTFDPVEPYNVEHGPFGFPPRPISADPAYASGVNFQLQLDILASGRNITDGALFQHYIEDYQAPAFPDSSPRLLKSQNYTEGALKGNYNPFTEKWEWNYKPEPQGGFYSHGMFGSNWNALEYLEGTIPFNALPLAMQQGLCPIDVQNVLSQSSRMKCYAKYNNSHLLDFTGVNPEDMTQQVVTEAGMFVPDIIEDLPNNNIDAETSFNQLAQVGESQALQEKPPNSVAFVKCEVEETIFLPPRLETLPRLVWGNDYEFTFAEPEVKIIEEPSGCTRRTRTAIPEPVPIFSIPANGGSGEPVIWTDFRRRFDDRLNGFIIDTQVKNQDDEHAYALVTVPGRIQATIDSRWQDGPLQAYNTVKQKHLMTMDVVKIPEFSRPSMPNADLTTTKIPCGPPPIFGTSEEAATAASGYGLVGSFYRSNLTDWWNHLVNSTPLPESGWRPGREEDWIRLSLEEISTARRITKTVMKGFALNQPAIELGYTQPSPVFPDIIALPMMSEERCYGPWLSITSLDSGRPEIKYADIGGKVEFLKDENLAPWNYTGYQLMNQAGSLQAQFSNSLLLFSERGGFVIPDAPTGIALATALKNEGPIITSIGIAVGSDNGVKTTVKLDLYTASFGKLQRHQEMAITQVARERQKLLDEKNNAIRRGLGKRQTSADLVETVMDAGGRRMTAAATEITKRINANEKLGREIEETYLVVGKDGATTLRSDDLNRVMGVMDQNTLQGQLSKNVITTAASMWQIISNIPNNDIPSVEPDVGSALNDRLNNANHQE